MRRKLKLEELGRLGVSEFRTQQKIPLIFVLDNIRSGLNVGSAFRTADAFAIEAVILCGITVQPPHREILKTAIGANETVNWRYFEKAADALNWLKGEGWTLIGLEQTSDSVSIFNYRFEPGLKTALVFGNEVGGISDEILHMLDAVIEIPQFGTKHSLNVSVTIGISAAEFRRQWERQ